MVLQTRIKNVIEHITEGMYEREEIIAVALLGALSNQNTFLFGPPGTAKSLISRRIACAFEKPVYFEYLMNRFSTPEELFGPVSIKELKQDNYVRKTEHYLPKAEFAFLDEIWKSSPAILNTLLTMINEKVFKNGSDIQSTPLKALIAASNETPQENQGLDALYDRFIVRVLVGPIVHNDNFEKLINAKPTVAELNLPEQIIIKQNEWQSWCEDANKVTLSMETLTIIRLIRKTLSDKFDELGVYVSDRRWQKAAQLLKASAFFNDRKQTNHSDALLLSYCLWTKEETREAVVEIVHGSVKEVGFETNISLHELDKEKGALDKEIHNELFHTCDVYKTKNISDKKYFEATLSFKCQYRRDPKKIIVFIPYAKMNTKDDFCPVDLQGNELSNFSCSFKGQGTCHVEDSNYDYDYGSSCKFTPKILFHKDDKKEEVNMRLVSSLKGSIIDIRNKLQSVLATCEGRNIHFKKVLASPFISHEHTRIPLYGVEQQIQDLALRIKDCQRLEALCSE
jgi:MoxR-like ATPase